LLAAGDQVQKQAWFRICSHRLIPIELIKYILLNHCKTLSHSCSSLHVGVIPKQKSKTQTTGVKTTNWQWKEVSGSEQKLSHPLRLLALGPNNNVTSVYAFDRICIWRHHLFFGVTDDEYKSSTEIRKFPFL